MARKPLISLNEVLSKDLAHGSKSTLITGLPGAGKTTLLMQFASRLVPHDLCILRGLSSGQEYRYPGEIRTIAYRCSPKFYAPDGKLYNVPIKSVQSGFEELLGSCELNKLNVIYFPFGEQERGFWASFARFLVQRSPGEYASNYISIFCDEAEDVIPSPSEGTFSDVKDLVNSIKNFRKSLISGFFATQRTSDLHWLIQSKLNFRVYLRGAFVPSRDLRVHQGAVDRLRPGMGILSGGLYAYFTFGNLKIRKWVIVRQPNP